MQGFRIIQAANPGRWSPFPVSAFVASGTATAVRMEDFVRDSAEEWKAGEVFVIDACLTWGGCSLSSFAGIRLLKILRLLGYRQHCILYSFLPLRTLLSLYPHSEILLSAGTTYLQLPCVIDEPLCRSVADRPCEEDITMFFRAEATELLKDKRHSLANWWGMLRMFDILHRYCGVIQEETPAALRETLHQDGSYQGMLMNHIRFQGPPPPFPADEAGPEALRQILAGLQWRKGKDGLKVVFVDDEADKGWSYLLQFILYGKERPDLFHVPVIPRDGIDVDELAGKIREENPELIILDMRLAPQDESASASRLSGFRLLNRLVSGVMTRCPILVFTASDKRVVRDKVLDAGADAMWTKEGIDEGREVPRESYRAFSLARFRELTGMIADLTGRDYQLLYGFLDAIRKLEERKEPCWWENASWYPGDTVVHAPIDRAFVVAELKSIFFTHKRLLSSKRPEIKESLYEILMLRLGRMLEVFHPSWDDQDGSQLTLGRVIAQAWPPASRPFAYAMRLVHERNDVVHFNPFSTEWGIGHVRYAGTLSLFFDYLTMDTGHVKPSKEIVGELTKFNNTSKHCLKSGAITAVFRDVDEQRCVSVLGGKRKMKGVRAQVRQAHSIFQLSNFTVSRKDPDEWEKYWSANYWVVRWGPWGADLFLRTIMPRKWTFFLVDLPEEALQPGTTLYFHASLSDNGVQRDFSLSDVTLEVPEEGDHTYWKAVVQRIGQKRDNWEKTPVFVRRLEPPFSATFKAPASCLNALRGDKGASRILFLPKWLQIWMVENPVVEDGTPPEIV